MSISPSLLDPSQPGYVDLTLAHTTPEIKALRNTYVREGNLLKKRLPNGTLETVDSRDIASLLPKELGINTASVSGETILKYFADCIRGSPQQCAAFLANPNFHELSYKAIDDMSPLVARDLLLKYGFTVIEQYDGSIKQNINKMMSVGQWQSEVVNKLADQSVKNNIISNYKLTKFLEALVDKLDQSPAVLNEGYKGEPLRRVQYVGRIGKILPMMPNLQPALGAVYAMIPMPADVARAATVAPAVETLITSTTESSQPSFPMGEDLVGGRAVQYGGVLSFRARDLMHNSSAIFRGMYLSIKQALNRMGKSISQPDDGRIVQLLDQLEEKEKLLNDNLQLIEKYLNSIRSGNVDENNVNSVEAMQRYVSLKNKAVRSVSNRQNLLMGVYGSLGNIIIGRPN